MNNKSLLVFFQRSLYKEQFREYLLNILSLGKDGFTASELNVVFNDIKKSHCEAISKGYLRSLGYTTVKFDKNIRGRAKVWSLKPELRKKADEILEVNIQSTS